MLTQKLSIKLVIAFVGIVTSMFSFNAQAINYSYDVLGRLIVVTYDNGNNQSDVCDADDDNDGIPDAIEIALGLNPLKCC